MSDEKETGKTEVEAGKAEEETNAAQPPKEMLEFPIKFRDKDFKFSWEKGSLWAEVRYVVTELLYEVMVAEKKEVAELAKVAQAKLEKEKETTTPEVKVEN